MKEEREEKRIVQTITWPANRIDTIVWNATIDIQYDTKDKDIRVEYLFETDYEKPYFVSFNNGKHLSIVSQGPGFTYRTENNINKGSLNGFVGETNILGDINTQQLFVVIRKGKRRIAACLF